MVIFLPGSDPGCATEGKQPKESTVAAFELSHIKIVGTASWHQGRMRSTSGAVEFVSVYFCTRLQGL